MKNKEADFLFESLFWFDRATQTFELTRYENTGWENDAVAFTKTRVDKYNLLIKRIEELYKTIPVENWVEGIPWPSQFGLQAYVEAIENYGFLPTGFRLQMSIDKGNPAHSYFFTFSRVIHDDGENFVGNNAWELTLCKTDYTKDLPNKIVVH